MNNFSCCSSCSGMTSAKVFPLGSYIPYEPGYGHTFGSFNPVGVAGPLMGVPTSRPYPGPKLPVDRPPLFIVVAREIPHRLFPCPPSMVTARRETPISSSLSADMEARGIQAISTCSTPCPVRVTRWVILTRWGNPCPHRLGNPTEWAVKESAGCLKWNPWALIMTINPTIHGADYDKLAH